MATNSDDDTMVVGLDNVRLSVMMSVPSKDVEEDKATLEAIQKLNSIIKCLINKIPSVKLSL